MNHQIMDGGKTMSWILWIICGAVLLSLLAGGSKNAGRKGGSGGAVRIDRPHLERLGRSFSFRFSA